MYDGGNRLTIKTSAGSAANLVYTNTNSFTSAGTGDVQYYTYKQTGAVTAFVAEFTSASSAITGFKITGNVGADGGGSKASGMRDSSTWTGLQNGWSSAFKQIYSASDPSVNHLVVAPAPIASQSIASSTDDDLHDLTFSSGVSKVVYVLWAGNGGYQFGDAYFQSVAEALSSACSQQSPSLPPQLDTFLGSFTYSSSTSKVTKTSGSGYNGVAYTSSSATRYVSSVPPSSFAHSSRTRSCLFSITSDLFALLSGSISGSCKSGNYNCRFGLHAAGTDVRAASATSSATSHVPCLAPSLPPSHRRRTADAPPYCSQPSPSRIFCTDTLPNGHLTSQETTIYSQPFNGYQIWFHSSGKGETICGTISSRSGSTSNFWTQGDGSTIGKVEVDGSDIKMYVGGTLIRTCTGGASNTMYAHAYVFQSDSEFTVDSIS